MKNTKNHKKQQTLEDMVIKAFDTKLQDLPADVKAALEVMVLKEYVNRTNNGFERLVRNIEELIAKAGPEEMLEAQHKKDALSIILGLPVDDKEYKETYDFFKEGRHAD